MNALELEGTACGACGEWITDSHNCSEEPTCQDCGKVVTQNACGCGFAVMSATELTAELNQRGIKAQFFMSGGGCGTIYIGEANAEGDYEYAVGPADYACDELYAEGTCWGVDGSEEATYYSGKAEDFTPAKVAELIINDYKKESK